MKEKKSLPLNLIFLKYFCDAVKLNSVSASAKNNFVTQSAISQAIMKLEAALGKSLVSHHQNRLHVYPEGELVFRMGEKILKEVYALEDELEHLDEQFYGRVEFACTHSFALAVLPSRLKQAKELYPGLEISFRLGHPGIIAGMIKQDQIDFGIVLDNEDWSLFSCMELFEGQHQLYRSAQLENVEEAPYIICEDRLETRLLLNSYQERFSQKMNVLMRVSSWEVIANLVEAGLGIGFFPDYIAKKHGGAIVEHRLDLPEFPYRMLAISSRSHPLSRQAQALLAILKKSNS